MEHLPLVADPYQPVQVPYLGGNHDNVYENQTFTAFPPQPANESDAAYLQAKFFFGLMREVLDLPVALQDFIREEQEQKYVTTHKLRDYLSSWKDRIDTATHHRRSLERDKVRIECCLAKSYNEWYSSNPPFRERVGDEIELSVQILASTLEHAVGCILDDGSLNLPWRFTSNEFLDGRMLSAGWCPSVIFKVRNPARLVWQYYVSLLRPPHDGHPPDSELNCNAGDLCCKLKGELKPKFVEAKHVCDSLVCLDGTRCVDLLPQSSHLLESIVRDGGIPVLEYQEGVLVVKRFEKGMQYTAISHVWTDGLGSPEGNRMPKCQIDRLVTCMSKLPWTNKCLAACLREDTVWQESRETEEISPKNAANEARPLPFWIDTLCVPQDEGLRVEAINNMRAVYNRANRVLVFDAGLTSIMGTKLSAEEVLSRVSISNWVRRFWTLQEAVLAKIVWYQFGEECYRQLLANKDVQQATFDNEVAYCCEDFNFDWRLFAASWTYEQKVATVWGELKYRTSSFEKDQPVCVATLLDMSIEQINKKELGYHERLVKLWRMYKAVPTGVLFVVAPRLQIHGLRWAPKSITSLGMLGPPGSSSGAVPTEDGLKVVHHGIIATEVMSTNRTGVIALKVENSVYLVRQNLKQGNTPWKVFKTVKKAVELDIDMGVEEAVDEHIDREFDEELVQDIDQSITFAQKRVAILLAQSVTISDHDRRTFERALGALVAIHSMAPDGTITAEYLRAVSVLLKGSKWETAGQRDWSKQEEQEKAMTVSAKHTPMKQRWLIT